MNTLLVLYLLIFPIPLAIWALREEKHIQGFITLEEALVTIIVSYLPLFNITLLFFLMYYSENPPKETLLKKEPK